MQGKSENTMRIALESCEQKPPENREYGLSAHTPAATLHTRSRQPVVAAERTSKELIEYETVDAQHLVRLIEEYAVGSEAPQRVGTLAFEKGKPMTTAELKPNTLPHPEPSRGTGPRL